MRLFALLLPLLLVPAAGGAHGLSGYLEAKGFAFSEAAPDGESPVLGWATLFVKAEERLGATQLTGSVRAEDTSGSEVGRSGWDPGDRRAQRSPVSVRDLWARIPLASSVDLQLGRFELGWGKTDGYSPADAFLPRDLSDPFADEKLPLWAARLSAQREALRAELIVCPVTTPWRLPELGSRGAPVEGSSPWGKLLYRDEENAPPRPGFGALRLLATHGEWDVGAWTRYGVRPAPLLRFRTDQAAPTPSRLVVPVERTYAREGGVGIEVSRVLGPWVLRGEAAALFSADADLGDAHIGTVSLERGWRDGTLLVTLAADFHGAPGEERLLFDRALLPALIAAWNRTERWGSWKLVWTQRLHEGDGLVKGEVGYEVTELWKVTLGAEEPYGSEEGPLGALRPARRVRFALRRAW